jgi:hypothetical protein
MPFALSAEPPAGKPVLQQIDVAPVWAGHSVGFALLTHGDRQFVAYYDAQRRLTLAQRTLGSKTWKFKVLPSTLGWDSHNYVTMALDSKNCLHVSGNMHVVPLVYFRSSQPLEIDSVVPVNRMTGHDEDHVTYPRFLKGPHGELIFSYRDGRSGQGNNLLDIYDPTTKTWRRLLSVPLMDGQGKANAYMDGPDLGPDGYYHVSWVWRNTYDASTCHDLSYMRSRDLMQWETIDGHPLTLPITMATPGVLVDPVPVQGGILNGMGQVGFDPNGKVVLSYARYDKAGNTQLYLARFEKGAWKHFQATNWHRRIEFQGGGSLPDSGLRIGALTWKDQRLTIDLAHRDYGAGTWVVDPWTMKLTRKLPPQEESLALRPEGKVESSFPGMLVKWSGDLGKSDAGTTYRLRWETLPPNRDRPRDPPWPPPSMLRVVSLTASEK